MYGLKLHNPDNVLDQILRLSMMPAGLWTADGSIPDANDALLRITGYGRDDVARGRVRWKDMTPPEYAPLDAEALSQIRARGSCDPFEKEYVRKDGTRVPVMVAANSFGEGTPESGIFFAVDLSERRRVQRAANDFNNLLTVISVYAELIARDHPLSKSAGEIVKAVDRATELTRQLLGPPNGPRPS